MSYTQHTAAATSDLGATLRQWRQAAGLTQESLGGMIGVDQTTISLIEKSRRQVSAATLGAWARACGRPVDEVARILTGLAGFAQAAA
jgi:transcriptional regulator with XRE-family HTH domain